MHTLQLRFAIKSLSLRLFVRREVDLLLEKCGYENRIQSVYVKV